VKAAVETLSPTRVRLDIEVPFSELQSHVDTAYQTIAKKRSTRPSQLFTPRPLVRTKSGSLDAQRST
jgi:hypothetical protein